VAGAGHRQPEAGHRQPDTTVTGKFSYGLTGRPAPVGRTSAWRTWDFRR
jgi:hypothetical protein